MRLEQGSLILGGNPATRDAMRMTVGLLIRSKIDPEQERLILRGNAHPEGALAKAGQPETEQQLPKGTAFVDDKPTPGRVMPDVHHQV